MKSLIAALMLFGANAFADGFTCYTDDGVLKISVLNHVDPSEGTRTAHIMIVSDRTISHGKKTIAVFTDEEETLTSSSARWTAYVPDWMSKKGRNIAGTKLGYVDTLVVDVDHLYNAPVKSGARADGLLIVNKINGERDTQGLSCYRYLKN